MNNLISVYSPLDIEFSHGKGCYLWDIQGVRYLDAISGVGVTLLGHAPEEINHEIYEQIDQYLHLSNLLSHPWNKLLANKLSQITGLQKTFFCNSGSEANETAIKLARRFGVTHGKLRPKIIVMNNGFHGRTFGALSATSNEKYKNNFGSLLNDFIFIDFNNIDAIENLKDDPDITAIMLEPIQGEGGIHIAPVPYLKYLRKICDQQNWLLILDEIQCGLGRSGHWFYHQYAQIQPDILTLAKGLANGLPIGACLTHAHIAQYFELGSHGSTFGGNPLSCRIGLKVLELIEKEEIVDRSRINGEFLLNLLQTKFSNKKGIKSIRGQGLMIGIEFDHSISNLVNQAALDYQILINVTQKNIIRLLPPLIISKRQIQELVEKLYLVINQNA